MKPVHLLLLAALAATPAEAALRPAPGAVDARIRLAPYDPDQVYEVTGALGYELTVEFGEGERIENVAIGDSLAWQVTPNRRANLLFLKPIEARGRTNMTVITNLRRYAFRLSAQGRGPRGGEATYAIRFVYPEPIRLAAEPPPPRPAPVELNRAYSVSGTGHALPVKVFDDGAATYFRFAEGADHPAIFVLDAAHRESVTNVAFRDGYVVVDQLAPGFALRDGAGAVLILNNAWRPPATALPPASAKAAKGARR